MSFFLEVVLIFLGGKCVGEARYEGKSIDYQC